MVYCAWSSERLVCSESYVFVPLSPVFVPNFILVPSVIYLPSQRLGLGLRRFFFFFWSIRLHSTNGILLMATTAAEQVILNGPALRPPPGVKSNFVNPPNMDFIVILTISICTSFSTIAILLRLYTKLIVIRKVVFEDCTFQC